MEGAKKIILRIITLFYIPPIRRVVPFDTFCYAACGGGNMVMGWFLYFLVYNFVIRKHNLDLGVVVISPHIATLFIVSPIVLITGFMLMRNIAFVNSPVRGRAQLLRYAESFAISLLINYFGLKLLVEVIHVYPTPSNIITSLVSVVFSYLFQKYYTFRGYGRRD